jgi:hypothetical protein
LPFPRLLRNFVPIPSFCPFCVTIAGKPAISFLRFACCSACLRFPSAPGGRKSSSRRRSREAAASRLLYRRRRSIDSVVVVCLRGGRDHHLFGLHPLDCVGDLDELNEGKSSARTYIGMETNTTGVNTEKAKEGSIDRPADGRAGAQRKICFFPGWLGW